jgi:hypothetical protein
MEIRSRLIRQLKFQRLKSIALLILTGLVWAYAYWFFEHYEFIKIPLLTVLSFAASCALYLIWVSTKVVNSLRMLGSNPNPSKQ